MKKYLPIIIVTFLWIWPPIFIKLFTQYFDNYTQNFYRFLSGALILIIISLIRNKQECIDCFKNIKKFFLPAIFMFLFQIIWVAGIYLIDPTITSLITKANVLFVLLISFIFFKDERKIIKSKTFILGASLAILGVIGVILGKNSIHLEDFNLGAILILIAAIFWAFYVISIKQVVKTTDPFVAASFSYSLAVPLFFILALLFGDLTAITRAPPSIITLLVLSGIFFVGIANALNFESIKMIGASISTTFILVTPFFTGIASYFIFKELLTITQLIFGLILLIGCFILIRAENHSLNTE
jgi:drug/metabolite transporter (DMT)-like permease